MLTFSRLVEVHIDQNCNSIVINLCVCTMRYSSLYYFIFGFIAISIVLDLARPFYDITHWSKHDMFQL